MQFHLNGFGTNDPMNLEAVDSANSLDDVSVSLPETVDVLIVGCGPAGLTLAAQLAVFAGITTCIVDQKPGPLRLGQADGVSCRTMEMFNAFGFAEQVLKEACWVNETSFWRSADDPGTGIVRTGRVKDTEDGLSEFPHVILNQARVHEFYLDVMRSAPSRLVPHYGRRLVDVQVGPETSSDAKIDGYPVTVRFEPAGEGCDGRPEIVRARYVVGCDGARSTVRRCIGLDLKGDRANQAWGVMDVLALTDFPDIRMKAILNSAEHGSVVLIPREGGYLVRFYVEMDGLGADERVSARNITLDDVIAATRRVLHPYTLDVKQVAWWSVYEIGQRLCDRFDDVSLEDADIRIPRVFIAGDACHTHSPKAGQGMNVSMQDAFNLGWKLAAVLRGTSTPKLLQTYTAERHAVAKELIEFDREWAMLLSAPPRSPEHPGGVDPAEVQSYFVKHGHYTAGTATRYGASALTAGSPHQHLAKGFPVGKRFHSAPVIRLADAKPMQLGHVAETDGRWRLYAFSGNEQHRSGACAISGLCDFLAGSPASPVARYTPPGADIDSVFDLRAIFPQAHRTVRLETMPPFLLPSKGRFGLRDYEKVFCSDLGTDTDIYDMRGVDRRSGCIVVVRPDQYVAHVVALTALDELAAFFDAFMLSRH